MINSTEAIAGGAVLTIFMVAGIVLAFLYPLAPFVLYGIYSRLGRLIDLQEHLLTQVHHVQSPPPTPQQRAAELTAARAKWTGKILNIEG